MKGAVATADRDCIGGEIESLIFCEGFASVRVHDATINKTEVVADFAADDNVRMNGTGAAGTLVVVVLLLFGGVGDAESAATANVVGRGDGSGATNEGADAFAFVGREGVVVIFESCVTYDIVVKGSRSVPLLDRVSVECGERGDVGGTIVTAICRGDEVGNSDVLGVEVGESFGDDDVQAITG